MSDDGQQTHGGGQLAAFTRNKPLMIGAAAVAGLGLFVFMRKSGSTGGGTSTAPAGGGSAPGGGSDIGGQLGQFGNAVQRSLDEYGKTLNSTLAALQKAPGHGSTPPAAQGPVYARATAGQNVHDWLANNAAGTSYTQLDAWNPTRWGVAGALPGIQGNTNSHDNHALDYFTADALFRVK